jgi:hypothetical protein
MRGALVGFLLATAALILATFGLAVRGGSRSSDSCW